MAKYLRVLILFLFFKTVSFSLVAQNSDSLPASTIAEFKDSLLTDTTVKKNLPVAADEFTPDTVFFINGDKLTGNIISYDEGRLKMDAQGVGVISIKWQRILSVNGGSRRFKVEDVRNEIYTGPVQFSKDTGEIIVVGEYIYGIGFSDMLSLAPLIKGSDSLLSVADEESKMEEAAIALHSPDTVFLKTGDQITGKILSFEQGRLKIDAQGPGVVSIKWHKISSIHGGERLFKVEDQRGEIYIGHIDLSKDTGEILIMGNLKYGIMLEDIIRLFPLEEEWYRGFKGTMGGGLNYAKSSEVLNINLDYNLYYVISKWRFSNDFSYVETSTKNEDPSVRLQINFQALYALPDRWVLSEINSFNRNDELGINSRISFGIGGGNNIVQTETQRLLVLTGIMQNSEKNVESSDVISNFEWPFTLQHTVYSFASPNITAATSLTSYVGITEEGRYRFDGSIDITWEFITNVKLQLSAYYNYDNKSVEGKASEKDYGTVLSLLFDLK